MAPKRGPDNLQTRVAKYFEEVSDEIDSYMYKCIIGDNCNKIISGKKQHNLVSHAKTHQEFFRKNFQTEAADLLGMPARRLKFIQASTDMVTRDGQPFTALNGIGLQKLIAVELQVLTDAGYGFGLKAPQCEAVREHIPYLAKEIINQIKEEVKCKFVSLMVDTATKFKRSILGISLQYMLGSTIVIRTIGMMNLSASHTADHIATKILERLKLFDVKTAQLISVTSDNASNMTAMIQRFNEIFGQDTDTFEDVVSQTDECDQELSGNEEFEIDFQFSSSNAGSVEASINDVVKEMESSNESNEDLFSIIDVRHDFDTLLHDLEVLLAESTLNISGIRCAAHTLQLAVQNTLKTPEFDILIRLCRLVCKELRKSSRQYELDQKNISYKVPRMDCITRWNSTYLMVTDKISTISSDSLICKHIFLILRFIAFGFDRKSQGSYNIFCETTQGHEVFRIAPVQMGYFS